MPPREPRRLGFSAALRCPTCSTRISAERAQVHGLFSVCRTCRRWYWVLHVPAVNLWYLAETTRHEMEQLAREGVTIPELLRRFGATTEAA